jgi:HlyD family secretion protein
MAALAANISGAKTKMQEIELSILRINRTFHEKVAEELRTVEAELNTFTERLVSVEDQTQRTEIRAPRGGRILNLAVHNKGSVIKPGETIMEIVPDNDTLVIGARIAPQDIDKVVPRAPAVVRLSAFNQRTTPELFGEVQRVSADLVADATNGPAAYQAIIEVPSSEAERLQGLALVPGMPAEVFIRTGGRTPLAYLLKPLSDSLTRALRED